MTGLALVIAAQSAAAQDNPQDNAQNSDTVMDFADAQHLLLRTSFAPVEAEIEEFVGLSRTEAVERLLGSTLDTAVTPEPGWLSHWKNPEIYAVKMTKAQEQAVIAEQTQQRYDTKLWWMHEIRTTPSPVTEKMVMFWHNYFTMGMSDILSVHFVFRNNTLLRHHAFGNFRDMLYDISIDPGFMRWLNIDHNSKEKPNENFGREILELYTLGLGHYTEQDVINVARALTGWKINLDTGKAYFDADDHDNGDKTVLGQTGNFALDEVIDILMQQDATPRFIVGRMWKFFISHDNPPDEAELTRLGTILRENNYQIRPLLRAVLLSDAFWAKENRGNMFKSHLDLVLGTSRQLGVDWNNDLELVAASAQIGQDILDHSSVAGWNTGRGWVDTATLPQRIAFVTDMLDKWEHPDPAATNAAMENGKPKTYIDAWGNEREVGTGLRQITGQSDPEVEKRLHGANDMLTPEQIDRLAREVLARPPLNPLPEGPMTRAKAMRAIMLDPAYQFK